MVWMALAAGAKGIGYFPHRWEPYRASDISEEVQAEMKRTNAQLRDLAPASGTPAEAYSHTLWKHGTRLTKDPSGVPIKAADVTFGSIFHVIPEGLTPSVAAGPLPEGVDPGFVLAVGTIEPRKNYPRLLAAYRALRARIDTPPLVIAGRPGWDETRVRAEPGAEERLAAEALDDGRARHAGREALDRARSARTD